MTERSFTRAQLLEAACTMRGGSRYAEAIEALITQIEKNEEAARILAAAPARPTRVPEGFKRICVCDKGVNRGVYTIHDGDRHIWLPLVEANKSSPDLSLGVWDKDIVKV
jgi:hypothetical protein